MCSSSITPPRRANSLFGCCSRNAAEAVIPTRPVSESDVQKKYPEAFQLEYLSDTAEIIRLPEGLREKLPKVKRLMNEIHSHNSKENVGFFFPHETHSLGLNDTDKTFLRDWDDQLTNFVRQAGEKLTQQSLTSTSYENGEKRAQFRVNVRSISRDIHVDSHVRGEYRAVLGLSDGCTEIIKYPDKIILLGEGIKAPLNKSVNNNVLEKNNIKPIKIPPGYIVFFNGETDKNTTPPLKKTKSTLHRTEPSAPNPRHVWEAGFDIEKTTNDT